jgi:hypothetical protein
MAKPWQQEAGFHRLHKPALLARRLEDAETGAFERRKR